MKEEEKQKKGFSRRNFMVRSAVGVGVIMGTGYIGCSPLRRYMADKANTVEMPYMRPGKPTLWFEVLEDNQMIFHSPKVEMGQGIFTGLAQIAADELDVRIDQLKVVHASTDGGPIDSFATGGSTTISGLWVPLRELAATMKLMLKQEAARLMDVDVSTIRSEEGVFTSGTLSLTYGEVSKKTSEWKIPKTPDLKPMKDHKFIGKPVPRVDLEAKVKGEPIFGIDAHIDGMLYGSVARPSQVDVVFQGANIEKAKGMPGVVQVILEDDFVGVVATSMMAAQNAREAIEVDWKVNKVWEHADILSMIEVGKGNPVSIQKEGNISVLKEDDNIIESAYRSPIGAHAHLEPNGALADVGDDYAKVYISTQVVSITRDEVAKRLGMKKSAVIIRPTFLGGGFGGRLHTPNAMQAAVMSRAVGKPVHCFFDRKQEFQNDNFRPPTHNILKAKLTSDGRIEAIEHNISSGDVAFGSAIVPSFARPVMGADLGAWRGGMFHYENIPNYEAISWRVKLPFATSWWRSLGLLANTFAIESFMDELAEKAGKDPIDFRLQHVKDDTRGKRLAGVIRAARDNSNWGKTLESGRVLGFACSTDVNTPVAQVVELTMEGNQVRIHKVTCAIDPGIIINPDQVKAQCEGAIIMGLSAAMYEEMTIKDGRVVPTIYGSYRMALMKNAPKEIDVILLENGDSPRGVGEPPLGPIGAAIANAVYKITNKRVREMPIQRVLDGW